MVVRAPGPGLTGHPARQLHLRICRPMEAPHVHPRVPIGQPQLRPQPVQPPGPGQGQVRPLVVAGHSVAGGHDVIHHDGAVLR